MTEISELRGVGPALARILQENGVQSVEGLAGMEEQQLRSIPGIGSSRAGLLLDAARVHNGSAEAEGEDLSARLAAAETALQAAEEKAAKAEAKAKKAKRQAVELMEEFAEAKVKAKKKARKVKAKAKKAIEKEKAKAKAILEGNGSGKKKKKVKK
ncbi:helix-hairpin-helix domain-containing protein [Leisingera sp. ANG59]|uniref:helix-hairpin-helix domain-containing protein n=1 Tax=Leisingera sp. ANG59 TaxID=2675221 RepID=UPI0015739547|nr:helix-hairpin-helix domain-containing protein [Leisingera sp. ANG59]NSY36797.1 helix-hairpin-helix domain-containing protein [Leisingera sp. ANG59]